jgi:hypothetical protein
MTKTKQRTARSSIRSKTTERSPVRSEPTTQQIEYVEYVQKSSTDIPQHIVEALARDGHVLQWASYEVRGQPVSLARYKVNSWDQVLYSDWNGLLDFLGDGAKTPGTPIAFDGLQLMSRPIEVDKIARQHEKRAALAAIASREGLKVNGLDVAGGSHPSARNFNYINRTAERIAIPEDE